jgi:hypothetical protein
MAANFRGGDTLYFMNPENGRRNFGQLIGVEGGDLKVQTLGGVIYVDPSKASLNRNIAYSNKVKSGRKSRKNRNNRKRSTRKH